MKAQCNLWAFSKWLLEKLETVKDLLLIIKLIINMLRCYNITKRLATHSSSNDDYLWKVWWDQSENIPIFGTVKNALNLPGRLFVSPMYCFQEDGNWVRDLDPFEIGQSRSQTPRIFWSELWNNQIPQLWWLATRFIKLLKRKEAAKADVFPAVTWFRRKTIYFGGTKWQPQIKCVCRVMRKLLEVKLIVNKPEQVPVTISNEYRNSN